MVNFINYEFAQPGFALYAYPLIIFIIVISFIAFLRKYKFLKKFSENFSFSKKRFLGHFFTLTINILLILGIAFITAEGMFIYKKTVPAYERLEISIWMDVSLSSLAEDIVIEKKKSIISRLDYQKMEIVNLLKTLDGDFVTIGIFSSKAFFLTPSMIINKGNRERRVEALEGELEDFNAKSLDHLIQGSNIAAPIYKGLNEGRDEFFNFLNKGVKKRILIVLTDGEAVGDIEVISSDLNEALRSFASYEKEVSLYIIGVGNPYNPPQGSYIRFYDENGNIKIGIDANNQPIRTKPDFDFMKKIAEEVNGKFIGAKGGYELADALKKVLVKERNIIGEEKLLVKEEKSFRWVALFLLGLLLLRNPFFYKKY